MKFRRSTFRIFAFLCLAWLLAPAAWAGDCSGPGDCGATRDNAPKAAGGAAIATAIALALRGSGNDDDSTETGEGKAQDEDALLGAGEKVDTGPDTASDQPHPPKSSEDSDLDVSS